jgi:cytosine/creatinine deaminase
MPTSVFHGSTLYTTMSCCPMCTGAAIWFKVARVVIGDSTTYTGPEDLLRSRGIEVVNLNHEECINLSKKFIEAHPEKWADTIESPTNT